MLVAGAFEDPHLTSTVLWLNKFGVEITCVELTPYRMGNSKKIAVVPKVIIPLPQAREYLIQVKEKELAQSDLSPFRIVYRQRNQQILNHFRNLSPEYAPPSAPARNVMQIPTGRSGVHYEWWQQVRSGDALVVGLHFETSSPSVNQRWCKHFRRHRLTIEKAVGEKLIFNPKWGKWASINIKKPAGDWSDDLASGRSHHECTGIGHEDYG